jgi:uncharacterized protein (TIGR00369 family)
VTFLERFQAIISGEVEPPPVSTLVGFAMTDAGEGFVVMELDVEERHTSPPGSAHGGILCDVADAAMGCAYGTLLDEDEATWTTVELKIRPARKLDLVGLQAIRDGLYSAAHDPGGTSASIFGSFPIPVSGKTGTAEAPPGSDPSWYASWAPSGNPRYVVVVLIEHGGFGAETAAPAARQIYSALFNVKPADASR